ncbi:MAG: hypothetical protein ACOX1S_10310 [Anaerostipes sp.]|jgi:hypothetical protein
MSVTTINKTEQQIEQDVEQKVEQPYTLRALAAKDVFPMVKIISKIGINEFTKAFESEEIKQLITAVTSEEETEANDKLTVVGISIALDVANTVLVHLGSCEQEIYSFLSGVSGMTKQEIEELPMGTFFEMIVDVFKKAEFKNFIGVVSKFFK